MDRTYYSSVENGERNISIINIKKITSVGVLKYIVVSLSELFDGIDKN